MDTPAKFQPASSLRDRTFIGLLVAQFLAAFNDQAIHAAAMFFAINRKTLTEGTAISLMPILFFAPWAIFCTLAGYLADKYSKRRSLVFWKLAEIAITAVALVGFIIGSELNMPDIGVWIVLSTVFLMGMHSTFFVPAKYGCMPEILQPHLLSRGNGLLESLSFLATILGTVCGGILSQQFNGNEYIIGITLLVLAVVGAAASFMIREMPSANPLREFPKWIYLPLFQNLKNLIRHRPLAFALVGIAFFTFMVAFMRAAVYMLGESRIPRWNEATTSEIVGMTALGIGIGSPLAGWLSGKKVELGLIPIGGIGMVLVTCLAAVLLDRVPGLVTCIVFIGFFTGFYLVPMFTLLQHRAPKQQKGEVVSTSNFVNVTGAIAASVLFFAIVSLAHFTNFAPRLLHEPHDVHNRIQEAYLTVVQFDAHHRPVFVQVAAEGHGANIGTPLKDQPPLPVIWDLGAEAESPPDLQIMLSQEVQVRWNHYEDDLKKGRPLEPILVRVTTYAPPGAPPHIYVRLASEKMPETHDNRQLPRYLFVGAGAMTLAVLVLLLWLLPDILRRSAWVLRSLGKQRLRVHGIHHLPGSGAVVLVHQSDNSTDIENIAMACDRQVHAIDISDERRLRAAVFYIKRNDVLAISIARQAMTATQYLIRLMELSANSSIVVLPVHCGPAEVFIGEPVAAPVSQDALTAGIAAAAQVHVE
jgi:MFS family permease